MFVDIKHLIQFGDDSIVLLLVFYALVNLIQGTILIKLNNEQQNSKDNLMRGISSPPCLACSPNQDGGLGGGTISMARCDSTCCHFSPH